MKVLSIYRKNFHQNQPYQEWSISHQHQSAEQYQQALGRAVLPEAALRLTGSLRADQ
jgi:hypothetical protein